MRTFIAIPSIAVVIFIVTCFVKADFVTAGALLDPPQPGGSTFIEAYGFPLPVYAQNYDARLGPTGWKIFWKAVGFNLVACFFVSTVLVVTITIVRAVFGFLGRLFKSRAPGAPQA